MYDKILVSRQGRRRKKNYIELIKQRRQGWVFEQNKNTVNTSTTLNIYTETTTHCFTMFGKAFYKRHCIVCVLFRFIVRFDREKQVEFLIQIRIHEARRFRQKAKMRLLSPFYTISPTTFCHFGYRNFIKITARC